jgi:HD-like signal output (HDOD) protein/GGDEF domain-containing protein
MSVPSLDRILACPTLPTLPVVALRVLELTSRKDVSLRELAAVIEHDPAIASKVLRTVNSSFYNLSRRCGSIQQALAFLGLQTVKALVLGFSLARSIDGGGDDEVSFDFLSYWRRSIYSATAARQIAMLVRGVDPDEAFVTALMQDVGMVALWRVYGDRYLQVIDLAGPDHRRLVAMELRALEIDHAAVSSEMCARWRFPDHIVQAVRCHHRSHEAAVDCARLARTVELAGTAANVLSLSDPESEIARFRRDGQEWFEVRPAPLLLLIQKISEQATELSREFGLDVGARADVDSIMRRAREIRDEHRLIAPDVDAECADAVEHGCIRLETTPDARAFGTDLEAAFPRGEGRGGIAMLLVGIDRAKHVQEAFGARGVEAAMLHAASNIRRIAGPSAAIYRFVGAELAVLVRDGELEELCRIAEHVRRGFSEGQVPCEQAGEGGFPATVSIGVSNYEAAADLRSTTGIETPDQLVRGAMFALAVARRTRNKVAVFHRDLRIEPQAA